MSKESATPTVIPRGLTKAFTFWQDREVRFDSEADVFNLRPNSEEVLATFHHVEDTKGNNGQIGTLMITNLRLVWWSAKRRALNLSIGYHCVLNVTVQEAQSKLFGGTAEALFVSCKYSTNRFMFVFTHVPRDSASGGGSGGGGGGGAAAASARDSKARLYTAVSSAWRAYDSTRIYREIRLRAAIITQGMLNLLDGEQILSKLPDISSVSKETEYKGVLIITNLRVVWFARREENFNVSIPYMQFTAVRSQNSRFGPVVVIETSRYAGSYVLGFRVDTAERVEVIFREISSLWKVWTAKPILGMNVTFTSGASGGGGDSGSETFVTEGEGGGNAGGGAGKGGRGGGARDTAEGVLEQAPGDAFAAYYADEGQKGSDRKPTYNGSIGLAVEKLRKGVTLQDLWNVTVT